MKVRHHPTMDHLMRVFRHVGANQGGILSGYGFQIADLEGEPWLRQMTGNMPRYHRTLLENPELNLQYHLSGYGATTEEAFVKCMGEAIERYAGVTSATLLADHVQYGTFAEMASRARCLPVEYLSIMEPDQQAEVAKHTEDLSDRLPTEHDLIGWVDCPSLVHPGETTRLPAQLVFGAYRVDRRAGDKIFSLSFSTGTATHVTAAHALRNALCEAIQIDAFMVRWLTRLPGPRVVVNDDFVTGQLRRLRLGEDSKYEVLPIYLTLPELPLPNVGFAIVRREPGIPFISYGLQGDPNPTRAVLRAAHEAVACLGMGNYQAIFDTVGFLHAVNESAYLNLDDNVLLYASPVDADEKVRAIREHASGQVHLSELSVWGGETIDDQVPALTAALAGVSEYAGYLDVTPPELADTAWKVIRVVVPELVSMCLPGMPPRNHPRLKPFGGVSNEYPHPLA